MAKITNTSKAAEIPVDIDQFNEELGFVLGVIQMIRDLEDLKHLDISWVTMEAERKIKNIKRLINEPFGFRVD
jgi:hypothetical protein